MLTRAEIKEKIIETVFNEFPDLRGVDIKETDKLVDSLGLDSLDMIELVLGLEEGFNLDIPEDDIKKVETFEEVIELFFRKVQEDGK